MRPQDHRTHNDRLEALAQELEHLSTRLRESMLLSREGGGGGHKATAEARPEREDTRCQE